MANSARSRLDLFRLHYATISRERQGRETCPKLVANKARDEILSMAAIDRVIDEPIEEVSEVALRVILAGLSAGLFAFVGHMVLSKFISSRIRSSRFAL
ncbi:hypothetical protein DF058_15850 [Burkholderia cenocepacia]|nr:hypothetical protein DF058_15850 [Burkholderia cenocepacia]RRA14983.1 hypothetical protein DF059_15985 [Burkholderia cenocepacia]